MQKLTRTCSSDSLHFLTLCIVSVCSSYTISTTVDYMHPLAFYICLNYPAIYSLSEREREAVNMQGTVFTLARLETVHTKKLNHIQCQSMLMN